MRWVHPPSRERRGGGTGTSSYAKVSLRGGGRPGDVAVGDLGWYASDRCAGFPHATAHPRPSRERRGGGTGTSSYAKKSPLRGGGRPGDVAVGDLGWYASDRCAGFLYLKRQFGYSKVRIRLRGNDKGARERRRRGGGTAHPRPSRDRHEGAARERRVMQKSPLRGSGRPGDVAVGDLGWYASDRCAGFPPSRERRGGGTAHPRPSRERQGGGAGTSSYAKVSFRGKDEGRRRTLESSGTGSSHV